MPEAATLRSLHGGVAMPPTLAQPAPTIPRGFGQKLPVPGDRWPMPQAAVTIIALSVCGWLLLVQGGRAVLALMQ